MDSIRITGGKRLEGRIPISGAKNSALTLLPCALLTADKLTLTNLPRLADVDNFSHLLNGLGASTKVAGVKKGEYGRRMTLSAREIASTVAPGSGPFRTRSPAMSTTSGFSLLTAFRTASRATRLPWTSDRTAIFVLSGGPLPEE